MRVVIILAFMSMTLVACSSGGSSDSPINVSTLGSVFATYSELSEANNNSESTSEITPYLLDTKGLKINGTFESSVVTADYYRFNTSTYSTIDVSVFIDGVKQTEVNSQVSLTLNNYIDDSYSTLRGNGYFINASVSPPNVGQYQFYVIGISHFFGSDVSGSTYTIELHHSI